MSRISGDVYIEGISTIKFKVPNLLDPSKLLK